MGTLSSHGRARSRTSRTVTHRASENPAGEARNAVTRSSIVDSIATWLANLPDEVEVAVMVGSGQTSIGDLRKAFTATQHKRILTTGEASNSFGYSTSQWAKWAPGIKGAYQDATGGPWRLPYDTCVAQVAQREIDGKRKGRNRRGRPWKKAERASPPRERAASVSRGGLAVLQGGSPALGDAAPGASQPERSRLAGPRGTDRGQAGR